MTAPKTRCKQCVHADKKATCKPCNACSEILSSPIVEYENSFLDASKNLLKKE